MIAALALVAALAQDCHGMLPPPNVTIEWFRNGRPHATDHPTATADGERRYRRELTGGRSETRVLSCTGAGALVDRTANTSITLPLNLAIGSSRRVGSASVQRIQPPAGAQRGSAWFYISHLEAQRIAVRPGVGIEEIQTLGRGSDVDILFARVVGAAPQADSSTVHALSAARERVRQLESQAANARTIEVRLRDSIAVLRSSQTALTVMRDSARTASANAQYAHNALETGVRMLADSAARLPSATGAWNAAFMWPGAGQIHLRRGGSGWALIGGIAAATAVTALALPADVYEDRGLDADDTRRVVIGGSAVMYAGALLYARSLLGGTLRALDSAGLTRESFLSRAAVELGSAGEVRIIVRTAR